MNTLNAHDMLIRNAERAMAEVLDGGIQRTFAEPVNHYMRDWPDDEVTHVPFEEPERLPGSLYVTPREFLRAGGVLRKLGAMGCWVGSTGTEQLAHEMEHNGNAEDQGVEGTVLGLQLALKGDETHGCVVGIDYAFGYQYGYRLPKLAVVSWAVAPVSDGGPSAGDEQLAIDMGYEGGSAEVRQRRGVWNENPPKGHKPIPAPFRVRIL